MKNMLSLLSPSHIAVDNDNASSYTIHYYHDVEERIQQLCRDKNRDILDLYNGAGAAVAFIPFIISAVLIVWDKIAQASRPDDDSNSTMFYIACTFFIAGLALLS